MATDIWEHYSVIENVAHNSQKSERKTEQLTPQWDNVCKEGGKL